MTGRPGSSPASHILVVDDVGAALDVMCDALRQAGFEVEPARSVAQAIALMATRRYAVILADVFLPGPPAIDRLAAIRGAAPDTPLVLVTGSFSLDEVNALAAEWCATEVLHKPFTPAVLVEAVRHATSTRNVRAAHADRVGAGGTFGAPALGSGAWPRSETERAREREAARGANEREKRSIRPTS